VPILSQIVHDKFSVSRTLNGTTILVFDIQIPGELAEYYKQFNKFNGSRKLKSAGVNNIRDYAYIILCENYS